MSNGKMHALGETMKKYIGPSLRLLNFLIVFVFAPYFFIWVLDLSLFAIVILGMLAGLGGGMADNYLIRKFPR